MGTSTRNFGLALTAAAFIHGLLLAQKLVFEVPSISRDEPLRVTIVEEKVPEPTVEPVVEQQPTEIVEKAEIPKSLPPNVDKLIVATKSEKEVKPRVVIQTSLKSSQFKNWLKFETDNFTSQNPDAVNKFDRTFEEPLPYQSPEELSFSNPKSVPRGSTAFMVEDNGRRTCIVKILDMLDVSGSPSFVSKDCTPKKKFDLKLNQPNNGWTDR